ncbi:site-specific integrase [Candidatus Bathyarchaeota archaeon]|nr:site-specific integrase [Candidatus Bathyarchaeota archaeon]
MTDLGGRVRPSYRHLLSDTKVKRWFDNVARGSRVTAEVYLRRLGAFSKLHETTPAGLLSMSDEELYDLVLDHVTSMEQRQSGSYVHSTVKAVKSWLSHNRRELKGKIRIKGAQDTPTLKGERVPTKEELRKILLSGDNKARAASVLVAHSGLRIETLGNYLGDDGLRVQDLPELTIGDGRVEFSKVPAMVMVRGELSKARHQYFTFLSEEGCEYVKNYFEERMRQGEEITSDSPLITPKMRMKPFIRTTNVGDAIRKAIRKAGYLWRPYVLRAYFDTELMLAESKGLVLRDYRQFWMGHKGDIENRYTTNKERLPEEVIEDMRGAYARSQEYLSTRNVEVSSEERIKEAFKKQLLLVAGFKQDEIDEMDLSSMADEEFQAMVRQRLLGAMVNNGAKQKVICVKDIEDTVAQGWEFVALLPDDRAIMRVPY